ncbi:hypothetical protein CgunFtcFv8_009087 [Champsocephalus gunnari]|uniref:Uncharacterized protein n=1 Tax=Champsocephalus gunnari TaxID=52237 RepID=A0AAN8HJL3_CHAGU|nr:hypothetical protein CgunFtcFv8_009087 [Champsocephalus gunnari]
MTINQRSVLRGRRPQDGVCVALTAACRCVGSTHGQCQKVRVLCLSEGSLTTTRPSAGGSRAAPLIGCSQLTTTRPSAGGSRAAPLIGCSQLTTTCPSAGGSRAAPLIG